MTTTDAEGDYLAPIIELPDERFKGKTVAQIHKLSQSCVHYVWFKEGHTLSKHLQFLAKRLGLESPKDNRKIVERLWGEMSKVVVYSSEDLDREHMMDHVRRDPGVDRIQFVTALMEEDILLSIRHPYRYLAQYVDPYPPVGEVEVEFRVKRYTIKQHIKKVGAQIGDVDACITSRWRGSGLPSYHANYTEEQVYGALADPMVKSVEYCFQGGSWGFC